jgi:hypothetical protein
MANTAATLSVLDVNESRRTRTRTVKIILAAGDYISGGVPLDLTAVLNPNNLPAAKFGRNPTSATVKGSFGTHQVRIDVGTTLASGWKLRLFDVPSGTIGVEQTVAALDAGAVTPNFILVDFIAPKNL